MIIVDAESVSNPKPASLVGEEQIKETAERTEFLICNCKASSQTQKQMLTPDAGSRSWCECNNSLVFVGLRGTQFLHTLERTNRTLPSTQK
eukprot:6490546-Amphidinium_carterae.1